MKRKTFLLVFILAHAALSGVLIYGVWHVFEVRYGSNTALSVSDKTVQVAANIMLSPALLIAPLVPGVERLPRLLVVPRVIVNSVLWALVVWWLIPKRWKAGPPNNRFPPPPPGHRPPRA